MGGKEIELEQILGLNQDLAPTSYIAQETGSNKQKLVSRPSVPVGNKTGGGATTSNFKKTETQDAAGVVTGSFVIALPDGRIQTTTYTADHQNGFVADVTYEGTPVYPPEPKEGYGHAAPAYAPAPAYKPAA